MHITIKEKLSRILSIILILIFFEANIGYCNCKNLNKDPISQKDFEVEFPPKDWPMGYLAECTKNKDYLNSMYLLERVIATQALKIPEVINEIHKINTTTVKILRLISKATSEKSNLNEEKVFHNLLKKYFGHCNNKIGGCVGSKSKMIFEAFVNGNIRERTYLAGDGVNQILKDFIFECDLTKRVCLCHLNDLSLDIKNLCLQDSNILERGKFGRLNKVYRVKNTQKIKGFNPKDLEVPLSSREKIFLGPNKIIQFISGRDLYRPGIADLSKAKEWDPNSFYINHAKIFGFRELAGPSGTTDHFLSLGCIFGNNVESQQRLRLAMFANMIPHKHHSAYEILVSSKSFEGQNVPITPEYYKYLFNPDNLNFVKQVEDRFSNLPHRPQLPMEILNKCMMQKLILERDEDNFIHDENFCEVKKPSSLNKGMKRELDFVGDIVESNKLESQKRIHIEY